jgi:hypothetical protein
MQSHITELSKWKLDIERRIGELDNSIKSSYDFNSVSENWFTSHQQTHRYLGQELFVQSKCNNECYVIHQRLSSIRLILSQECKLLFDIGTIVMDYYHGFVLWLYTKKCSVHPLPDLSNPSSNDQSIQLFTNQIVVGVNLATLLNDIYRFG